MFLLPLKYLWLFAFNVAFVSFLLTSYNVKISVQPALRKIATQLKKTQFVQLGMEKMNSLIGYNIGSLLPAEELQVDDSPGASEAPASSETKVYSLEELASYDGATPSRPVCIALLGKVFDVEKGRKHYANGGGYSFFAGRDASRAFVTGDFSPSGLTDDISGLGETELLQLADWSAFYEREYKLVGVLTGTYYDEMGRPTVRKKEVDRSIKDAKRRKLAKMRENEIFPFCNSEWHKGSGGRVWCTLKSGGIERDWVGVPRMLFDPSTKAHRCACVKNFGPSLARPETGGSRGDLDYPNLRAYEECAQTANSCKLPERSN